MVTTCWARPTDSRNVLMACESSSMRARSTLRCCSRIETPFSTMRLAVAASAATEANATTSLGVMPTLPSVNHPFRRTNCRLNRLRLFLNMKA